MLWGFIPWSNEKFAISIMSLNYSYTVCSTTEGNVNVNVQRTENRL